jgi:hypothetical protein
MKTKNCYWGVDGGASAADDADDVQVYPRHHHYHPHRLRLQRANAEDGFASWPHGHASEPWLLLLPLLCHEAVLQLLRATLI